MDCFLTYSRKSKKARNSKTDPGRTLSYREIAAFTVMELLVVLGTLSMLLAIALPSIRAARNGALKRRAASEATALAQAAIHYKSEYGFWPGQVILETPSSTKVSLHKKTESVLSANGIIPLIVSGTEEFTQGLKDRNGNAVTFLVLNTNEVYQCFARVNMRQGNTEHSNPLNPKGIAFVGLDNEQDWDRVNKADPWGNPYTLLMGMNPRSYFELRNTTKGTVITAASNVTALAFSYGPPENGYTNYIFSEGAAK